MKKVIYNGGTTNSFNCSNPNKLEVGREYSVIVEKDFGYHTNYVFEEVPGEYNSAWFDEVKQTFFAISQTIPTVGRSLPLILLIIKNGKVVEQNKVFVSRVRKVEELGVDTYKVTTENAIYIVKKS